MPKFVDITGQRFGRLLVLQHSHCVFRSLRHGYRHFWLCQCDCGTVTEIERHDITSGHTTSCGCHRNAILTSGANNRTHGKRWMAEYDIWAAMIQRCCNPKHISYKYYGAIGIMVCERWRTSFANFFADMGLRPSSKHSIDRIDNGGNYEPGNCRWSTQSDQIKNQRRPHRERDRRGRYT